MDVCGYLYVLAQDRGTGYNPVLYIATPDGALKEIALRRYVSYSLYSLHGKIIVATSSSIGIIDDPSSPIRTIEFPDIGSNTLFEGEDGKVIVLGKESVEENERQFAQAVSVDLVSGQVNKKLLPAPHTEDVAPDASGRWPTIPGVRYAYTILVGASPDLGTLFYSFSRVQEAGDSAFYRTLGAFDTEKEKDLAAVYDRCCPPDDGYLQFEDYLMVSHFPEGGGSALLLHMKDLSPVVDWAELLKGEETYRLTIHPFGKYFLVGIDDKILVLSQDGTLLKEYPLPADLIGTDYTIVEYREENN